jgi:hypothetical protein
MGELKKSDILWMWDVDEAAVTKGKNITQNFI